MGSDQNHCYIRYFLYQIIEINFIFCENVFFGNFLAKLSRAQCAISCKKPMFNFYKNLLFYANMRFLCFFLYHRGSDIRNFSLDTTCNYIFKNHKKTNKNILLKPTLDFPLGTTKTSNNPTPGMFMSENCFFFTQ